MAHNNANSAIVKWNELGNALMVYAEKPDECIEAMFVAVRYLSPYASTVASFVKPMVIPDPIMIELNKINEKLSDINKKLDKIVSEIKEELKLNEYNVYLNKMHNMLALYTRFIQMPNTVTIDALIEQSKRNEMLEFINWLHREVMGHSLNPIIDFMKADDDYPKFVKWTQLILSHYSQAMLLHGCSVQLRPEVSKKILDQTIENDTILFEKNLREMTNVFTSFIAHLKQSYFSKLEDRVIIKVKELPKLDEQKLADELHAYVSDKYPFREWFVCVVKPHIHLDIFRSTKQFYFDVDYNQTVHLIEADKDGDRTAMSVKEFSNDQGFMEKLFEGLYRYKNPRAIFVTSTPTDDTHTTDYKGFVQNYLENIDDNTFCKYESWYYFHEYLCANTTKAVLDGLCLQYSSQILCICLSYYNDYRKSSFKYRTSSRASICFHKRPVRVYPLWPRRSVDVDIITIMKG